MDMGLLVGCPFALLGMPNIQFLFVGSRFCFTLPSDLLSRGSPCATLNLHLHQVGWGTSTPKLSNMPSIQPTAAPPRDHPSQLTCGPWRVHATRNGTP